MKKKLSERLFGAPEARATHREAREELARVSAEDHAAGRDWETDEYLTANRKVIDAEQALPRWRRGPA